MDIKKIEKPTFKQLNYARSLAYKKIEVDVTFFEVTPNAKLIVRASVGYNGIDLKAVAQKGIKVCNVPDFGVSKVADHTMMLILAATRKLIPLTIIVMLIKAGVGKLPAK